MITLNLDERMNTKISYFFFFPSVSPLILSSCLLSCSSLDSLMAFCFAVSTGALASEVAAVVETVVDCSADGEAVGSPELSGPEGYMQPFTLGLQAFKRGQEHEAIVSAAADAQAGSRKDRQAGELEVSQLTGSFYDVNCSCHCQSIAASQ